MEKLQQLMNEISKWSDKQFDNGQFNRSRALPISYHLQKEAKELTEAIHECLKEERFSKRLKTHKEFADVFILLLDAANHFGLNANELMTVSYNKLEVCKKRKWGKPDESGVVEHIRK